MQTVFPGFVVFYIFLTNYSDVVKFPLPKKIKSIQQVFTVLRARLLSVVMVTIIWLPTLIHALDVKEKKKRLPFASSDLVTKCDFGDIFLLKK